MKTSAGNRSIRNDIQALRAIAVLAVVVCHMNPAWLPGGYLGVDIFFVISGFVITQLLQNKGDIRLGHFWLQRIFRIFPAYGVMLTVVASIAAIVLLPENFSQFSKSWQQSLIFTSNHYFAGYGDYFSPAVTEQPLLHTWSLAVEMQFYMLYPFLFLIAQKLRAPWLLLVGAVVGFIYAQWLWGRSSIHVDLYYALFIRAPEFLLGCALSIYAENLKILSRRRLGVSFAAAGFLILTLSLTYIDEQRFSPLAALVACIGAGLVIAARVEQGVISAFYNHKALLLVGALSYSIYLWHWPVLAFARYIYSDIPWDSPMIIAYVLFVGGLSWVSWKFIEQEFKFNPNKIKEIILKRLSLILALAILPAIYAKPLNSMVPALPVELTRYADNDTICHGKMLQTCVRGVQSAPKFLLIGDSHAAQLNLASDVAGRALGLGIEVITSSSCVPLIGFNVAKLDERSRDACRSQIDVVSNKIILANKIVLAGMWSNQFLDPTFPVVLETFLSSAQAKGKRVWVLAQIPKFTKNPARMARLRYWGIDAQSEFSNDWRNANQQLASILMKYPSVQIVSPNGANFLSHAPFYEGRLIYHDEHHLNELGSIKYGSFLEDVLTKAGNQ